MLVRHAKGNTLAPLMPGNDQVLIFNNVKSHVFSPKCEVNTVYKIPTFSNPGNIVFRYYLNKSKFIYCYNIYKEMHMYTMN